MEFQGVQRHLQHPHDEWLPGVLDVEAARVVRGETGERPEAVLDGLMLLQDKIGRCDRTPETVKNTQLAEGADEALEKLYQIRMKP